MNFNTLDPKTTVFVGVDPAAVNIIHAVVTDLILSGTWVESDVVVYTNSFGIIHPNLKKVTTVVNFDKSTITEVLLNRNATTVFLGTSVGNHEWQWIAECSKLNIETISIIDYWSNYRNRYLHDDVLYLPSKILVIDKEAEQEAIAEGLPKELINVVRNPHFSLVEKYIPPITKIQFDIENTLNSLKTIVFVSDDIKANNLGLGFDEYFILEALLKAFSTLKLKEQYHFVIKLHPRDEPLKFDAIISSFAPDNLNVKVIKKMDSKLLCYYADYVIGMFSTMVIEALLLKKPVLRVEINQQKELFNFSEMSCPLVTEEAFLVRELNEFLEKNK